MLLSYGRGSLPLLVRNKADPSELVLALRSTEFIDDAARDNDATNKLEANDVSVAFGQLADRETWYAKLKSDPSCFRARTSRAPAETRWLAALASAPRFRQADQALTFFM